MLEVVIASNNQGKIKEINHLVSSCDIKVIPQGQKGVTEIEETGLTFIENAILKARHAASITKLPTIADDSGLVVPILQGEPGIYSARYAGKECDHDLNIKKLLKKLENVEQENRSAYFYCILVMMRHEHDPCPIVCEGIWHGLILNQPQGDQGFGYDPIFFDPEYGCSAAQLSLDVKNRVSHRGQAMQQLLQRLKSSSLDEVKCNQG